MAVRFKRQSQTCTRVVDMPRFMAPTDKLVNPADAEKGPNEMVPVYQEFQKDIFVPERLGNDGLDMNPPVTPPQCTGNVDARLAADVRAMQFSRLAA